MFFVDLGYLLGVRGPACAWQVPAAMSEEDCHNFRRNRYPKVNHMACAVDEAGDKLTNPFPFKNNGVGLENLIDWPEGLTKGQSDIYIVMEATGHYRIACFSCLMARSYTAH